MKRLAVVLILLLICAMPVNAKTCRNGRMTVYHNQNFRPYPNNHLYQNNNLYPIYHQNTNNSQEKPKPIYSYSNIKNPGSSQVSNKPTAVVGFVSK